MKLFIEEVDSPQNLIRKVSTIICTTVGMIVHTVALLSIEVLPTPHHEFLCFHWALDPACFLSSSSSIRKTLR